MDITIIEGAISKDYVQVLISYPPSISISKIVQQIIEKSSRVLLQEYKDLKRRYWGHHLWASRYFCRSCFSTEPVNSFLSLNYNVLFPLKIAHFIE